MSASAILKLQEVGFSAAQVRALAEFMDTQAASRADLMEVKSELKGEIAELRSELKGDIASIRSDMKVMERDLKIWFGRMMAWQLSAVAIIIGIATAAHKLL